MTEKGQAGDRLALCLMLLMAANSISMSLLPIVRSDLQESFGLSAAQIGLLTSVFMLTFGLGSIPAGVAVARWGGRTLIAGVACSTAGALLFALTASFPWFVLGRLLQGLGSATVIPVSNHLFTHYIAPSRQARALGIFGSGHGVGVIAALLILPGVEGMAGYRGVFLVTAAIGAVLGLIAAIQEPVRARTLPSGRESLGRVGREIGNMVTKRGLLLLAVINIGVMAVVVGILAWTPAFLHDQRGSSIAIAAYLTAGVGVAQLLGNIAGAAAMAKWGKPFVLLASMVVMMIVTAIAPVVPGTGPAITAVIIAGFLTMVLFPAIMGSVPDIVERKQVGSASGFLNLTNLVGTLLAPWVFGILLDRYGTVVGANGYLAGYLWLAMFPFLGSLAATAYMRERRRQNEQGVARPTG